MISKVQTEQWRAAQQGELQNWLRSPRNGDDWNDWWYDAFNQYDYLNDLSFSNILEVGCGPYALNLRYILEKFNKVEGMIVGFLDPLLDEYIKNEMGVCHLIQLLERRKNKVEVYFEPLEKLHFQTKYDVVICVNVLDHAYDVEQCFSSMKSVMNPGSILILGQDLTNEEDYKLNETNELWLNDYLHPIRIDGQYVKSFLTDFEPIFDKTLPREQGRNPSAHYGTLLYVGKLK